MSNKISFTEFYNIINNDKRSAKETCSGTDPSTGAALWNVPVATEQDLEDSVVAAKLAFSKWSSKSHSERSLLLGTYADRLEEYSDELTELLYRETGKPKEFAQSEIMMGWNGHEDVKIVVEHAPIGVVAGIIPWNFPFQLAIIKVVPALLVGCTMILKPSPFTPYTALKMGEIAAEVFPAGVFQVMSGDDSLGPWMTKHPGIDKVSFTGSITTGKRVLASTAETLKRVNLELGGNDAAIVTQDFNVAEAATMVAMSTFAHSGQICIATKRIYVHESIYNEFMQHFKAIVETFKPGQGFCSPIQNQTQYDKVKGIYQDCKDNNYQFAIGRCEGAWQDSEPGFFIEPAVIENAPDNSRIVTEEPFGPIVPVLKWQDDEEVISRANNTVTGLGGTVFCRDEQRAWKLAGSLATGNVWVNSGLKMDPVALFSAHKQSGIGSALGPHGLKAFTNTRTITYWKDTSAKVPNKGSLFV